MRFPWRGDDPESLRTDAEPDRRPLKTADVKTLSSLTNGRYLQVNMDENLRIGLHTADEYVPLEQVSRGTIEAGVLCAPHGGDGCALRRGGAAGDSR